MNIELAIALTGLMLTALAFILKALDSMSSKLRESLERENQQNTTITENHHKIKILETELDGKFDRLELINNGLLEKINHNRQRLEQKLNEIEKFLDKTTDYAPRNRLDD